MMSLPCPALILAELGKAQTITFCSSRAIFRHTTSCITTALRNLWHDRRLDVVCPSSRTAQCEDSSPPAVDPGASA